MNNEELLRQFVEMIKKELDKSNKSFASNFGQERESRTSEESLAKKIKASEESFKKHQEAMGKANKGVAAFIPALELFNKKVKKTSEGLEASIIDQTVAHKEASRAMYRYTREVGTSSKEMKTVVRGFDEIGKNLNKAQEASKKRAEVEEKLSAISRKNSADLLKSSEGFSHIPKVLETVRTDLKKARDNERHYKNIQGKLTEVQEKKLKEEEENIQALKNARDQLIEIQKQGEESVSNLKDALNSEDLRKAIDQTKDKEVRETLYKILEHGSEDNADIIEGLDELKDKIDGAHRGTLQQNKEGQRKLLTAQERFINSTKQLIQTVVAAMGDTTRKELSMVQERQRREGAQFGMRIPAAMMGMSEAEGLQTLDENRYLLRRMATLQEESGGGALFRSSTFRTEMQQLGHTLGLTGKEAADTILSISDSLRRFGVDATQQQLEQTSWFIKESHKRFGMSQDEMLKNFTDMSGDAALALYGGRDNILASTESVNDEIEMRIRLARVLNQEVDVQKQRLKQLNQMQFNDPAEALRSGVKMAMVGSTVGAFTGGAEDQSRQKDLLQRYYRGDKLSKGEREEAVFIDARTRLLAGERAAEGGFQERAVLSRMAPSSLNMEEAARERMRLADEDIEIPKTLEEFKAMSDVFAETKSPMGELNGVVAKLIATMEKFNGVMQSSIGTLAGGILGFVGQIASIGLDIAAIRALSGGRIPGLGKVKGVAAGLWSGGKRMAGAGKGAITTAASKAAPALGSLKTHGGKLLRFGGVPVAAGVGAWEARNAWEQTDELYEQGMISEEQARAMKKGDMSEIAGGTAGGVLGGAAAGALIGSSVPIAGTIAGGLIGAGVGYIGGSSLGRWLGDDTTKLDDYTLQKRQELLQNPTGNIERHKRELDRYNQQLNNIDPDQTPRAYEHAKSRVSQSRVRLEHALDAEIRSGSAYKVLDQADALADMQLGSPRSGGFSNRLSAYNQQRGTLFENLETSLDEGTIKELGKTQVNEIIENIEKGGKLSDDEREIYERLIERLTNINENTEDTAKNVRVSKDLQQSRHLANLRQEDINNQYSAMSLASQTMENASTRTEQTERGLAGNAV